MAAKIEILHVNEDKLKEQYTRYSETQLQHFCVDRYILMSKYPREELLLAIIHWNPASLSIKSKINFMGGNVIEHMKDDFTNIKFQIVKKDLPLLTLP